MKMLGAPLCGEELDAFAIISPIVDPDAKTLGVVDGPIDPGFERCADVKAEDGPQDVDADDAPPALFEDC